MEIDPFRLTTESKWVMTDKEITRARQLNTAYDMKKVALGSVNQKTGSIRNVLNGVGVLNADTRVLANLYPMVKDGAYTGPSVEKKLYGMVQQYFGSEITREIKFLTPQFVLPEISVEEKGWFGFDDAEAKPDLQSYLENRSFNRYIATKSSDAARVVFIADALAYEGNYGSQLYKAVKYKLIQNLFTYVQGRVEMNKKVFEEYQQVHSANLQDPKIQSGLSYYRKAGNVWSEFESLLEKRSRQLEPKLTEAYRVAGNSMYKVTSNDHLQKILETISNS